MRKTFGYTLAELLIALAVLGVIASFTIPKILTGVNSQKYNAAAKEAISSITQAYYSYQLTNTPNATTKATDLLPYLNNVKIIQNNTYQIDKEYMKAGTANCDGGNYTCVFFHNGGVFAADSGVSFGGTNTNNSLFFIFDPDGVFTDSTAYGKGKAIGIWLYFNGHVVTSANVQYLTINYWYGSEQDYYPDSTWADPPWFN